LDEAYHIIDGTVHTIALLLNAALLLLILTCSRFKIKEYKSLLLVTCLGDLALAIVVVIGEPAFLFEEGYIILVADGFFHGRNAIFDFVCVAVYCGMIHANAVLVVVQFIWRYQLICQQGIATKPFVKTWRVMIPLSWSVLQALNTFYLFALSTDPVVSQVVGRRILERVGWHPGTTAFPGMGHFSNIHTALHHCFYTVTLCGGYVTVVWCQYKIFKYMQRHGKSIRESTRRAHVEVNRAMVALAVSPLITSMGPSLIILGCVVLGFSAGPIMVYLSVGMSLITVANPLTTIYFVRSYRKAIVGVVKNTMGVLLPTSHSHTHPQTSLIGLKTSNVTMHNRNLSSK
ncbi:STR-94 protein, partial [Aphelenchoides avenae]